jgi:hypothetical protein
MAEYDPHVVPTKCTSGSAALPNSPVIPDGRRNVVFDRWPGLKLANARTARIFTIPSREHKTDIIDLAEMAI